MRLFVGLGNPGSRYDANRHNVGFMAVDAIARTHAAAPWRRRFQGQSAEAVIAGEKVVLLKPETFMNDSGRSVAEAQRFYKLGLGDLVVLHDELDLAPGKLRVKTGGGNAGHNGLRSISALCGNDYRRVRIGIGHPGHKDLVHGYVLRDFAKSEQPWVEDLLGAVADHAALLAKGDDAGFQNKVHLAMEARGWGRESCPAAAIDVLRGGDYQQDGSAEGVTIVDPTEIPPDDCRRRTKVHSWVSNAASSACRMSASRRSSTR